MESTKLVAEVRAARGKGPARRLRNEGKIPAVIYGRGIDSTALTLDPTDLVKALRGEKGRNSLFEIAFSGKSEHAMVREVAVDPVTRDAVHVDFLRIDPTKAVDAEVPVTTRGRALGVTKGGKLAVKFRTLPVKCLPHLIPVKIELDVTNVDLGGVITVADLPLPAGVTVTLRAQQNVVTVFEEKALAPEEGAATTAAAPAAGAKAAAPAAGAKAAAPAAKAPAKK